MAAFSLTERLGGLSALVRCIDFTLLFLLKDVYVVKINRTWNVPLESVQFSGTHCTHSVVQPAPPLSSRTHLWPRKETRCPLNTLPPFAPLPSLWWAQFCFWSLRICLLKVFDTNGIIQYMIYIWLLSQSIASARFTHVAARVRIALLRMAE